MLTEKVPNITQSLLLNAVDFNDAWKVQFPLESTKRDYFYSGKRETTEVSMMSTEVETFKFYEDLEMKYKFLELPYEDEKMSMILALPIQYDQPANLQIDGDMLCDIKSKMISTKLDMVAIPRMKFQFQTNLKEVLIDVGVKDFFHSFEANFSGICDANDFYIDDIVQKTLVEVDEEGNDAATITKLKFLPLAFRGVKEFIANHPFQFYVQDKTSGVILVAGRVDEPSESISLAENLRFM
ncbi:intracellular coagulation inhibitor 2-like [Uloborus diversus]|uniref:intracellular coagulation inhibitor 2-like n=1 Tax=Uloborus diversus TaxID=327109 RepID=UPI00240957B3|nr:intracellular coagulation inhibitor 2-like [Uloborus diversus]